MSEDYVLTDEGLIFWPKCKKTGCDSRRCRALESEYCYPHSVGLPNNFLEWEKSEELITE